MAAADDPEVYRVNFLEVGSPQYAMRNSYWWGGDVTGVLDLGEEFRRTFGDRYDQSRGYPPPALDTQYRVVVFKGTLDLCPRSIIRRLNEPMPGILAGLVVQEKRIFEHTLTIQQMGTIHV